MIFEQAGALRDSDHTVNQEPAKQGWARVRKHERPEQFNLISEDGLRSGPMSHPRRIGYVRVSTADQRVDRQLLQLEAHCDELRIEYVSAVANTRPIFERLMSDMRAKDTLVVLDVDRAFRSALDALSVMETLRDRGIGFDIINLPVDVQSDLGEFLYGSLALFAQLERKIIRRRTREGLAAAKRRGVRLGRPAHLPDETIREAHDWMQSDELPCRYVAALLGVSRLTLQRGFHRLGLEYPITPKEREAA